MASRSANELDFCQALLEVSMIKITLWINVCADDWTAETSTIASNARFKGCLLLSALSVAIKCFRNTSGFVCVSVRWRLTVLSPNCHSAVQTQTQTQTEPEAHRIHEFNDVKRTGDNPRFEERIASTLQTYCPKRLNFQSKSEWFLNVKNCFLIKQSLLYFV